MLKFRSRKSKESDSSFVALIEEKDNQIEQLTQSYNKLIQDFKKEQHDHEKLLDTVLTKIKASDKRSKTVSKSPNRPMSASNLTANQIQTNLEKYLENKFKSIDEQMEVKMRQALLNAHNKKKEMKSSKHKLKREKRPSKVSEAIEEGNSFANILKKDAAIDKTKEESRNKHKNSKQNNPNVPSELGMDSLNKKKSIPIPL